MLLKKRLFRANMAILFFALIALMAIVVLVLFMFEDQFEQQLLALSAAFPEALESTFAKPSFFTVLVLAVLTAGIAGIAVLLMLASFFTRRLTRLVMEPLEQLTDGARRIQDGNLEEAINYHGEAEFEQVCQMFNAMQKTIRDDRRQLLINEQARTDMVKGISHDLRTPLTSIQGYIKGVLDQVADTPEKQRQYLQTAYAATKEMNVLLQKLFDFAAMESGQLSIHLASVDLSEYTALYAARKSGQAQIRFDAAAQPVFVQADAEQLMRVYDNLLENSLKYAGVDPLKVTITLREESDHVLLVWKDNGKGVPPDKLPHIFERFYRCDEARREKGSGVGLYVVRCIMERHHGTIRADNDGGLRLTLRFPKEGN